jgi:hypothetical protein
MGANNPALGSEVPEETIYVVSVVLADQCAGDRQIVDWVGCQKQCELAQVQFIVTERAVELLDYLATVRGHVERGGVVAYPPYVISRRARAL